MPLIGGVTQTVNNPSSGGGLLESILNAAGGVAGALGGLGGGGGEITYSPAQQQQANQIALAIMSPPKPNPLISPEAKWLPPTATPQALLAQGAQTGNLNQGTDASYPTPSQLQQMYAQQPEAQPVSPAGLTMAPVRQPQMDTSGDYSIQPTVPSSPQLNDVRRNAQQLWDMQRNVVNEQYNPQAPYMMPDGKPMPGLGQVSMSGYGQPQGQGLGRALQGAGNFLQRFRGAIDLKEANRVNDRYISDQRAQSDYRNNIEHQYEAQMKARAQALGDMTSQHNVDMQNETMMAAQAARARDATIAHWRSPETFKNVMEAMKATEASSGARAQFIQGVNQQSGNILNLAPWYNIDLLSPEDKANREKQRLGNLKQAQEIYREQKQQPIEQRKMAADAKIAEANAKHAEEYAQAHVAAQQAVANLHRLQASKANDANSPENKEVLTKQEAAIRKQGNEAIDDLAKNHTATLNQFMRYQGMLTSALSMGEGHASAVYAKKEFDTIFGEPEPLPAPKEDIKPWVDFVNEVFGAEVSNDFGKAFIKKNASVLQAKSLLIPRSVLVSQTFREFGEKYMRDRINGKAEVIPTVPAPPPAPPARELMRLSPPSVIPQGSRR